ncbi:MAG: hypothetical protein V1808_03180 [Candidatus Daviesbacteria bacterium]
MSGGPEIPSNCEQCQSPLNGAYSEIYKGRQRIAVICTRCSAQDYLEDYQKTRRLSSSLIMEALVSNYYPAEDKFRILADRNVVDEAVKVFEKEIWWEGGLQKFNKNSSDRGHSLKFGNLTARMYTLAGRVMITMEDNSRNIDLTVITTENNELYMGVQSVNATAREAVELLYEMRRLKANGKLKFQPDNKVSII